jgi:hypothetical protein
MFRRTLPRAAALLPLLAAAAPLALTHTASAATTITPMLMTDTGNTCVSDATCTLRGAITKANADPGSTINLLAGTYHLSVAQSGTDDGSTGDLDIKVNMTIKGAGAGLTTVVADAGVHDRIFETDNNGSPATVAISDLRVTGGSPTPSDGGENNGGGILNDGDALTVTNVIFDTNQTNMVSLQGIFWGNGGGLASNSGTITVRNSTFSNNTSFDGGGIFNDDTQAAPESFSNLLLTGNTADGQQFSDAGGGAIYNTAVDTATVRFSDIIATDNHATNMNGGGVYDDSSNLATVTYDRTTLSGNTTVFEGGGFYAGANARPVITNSTITGNTQNAPADHSTREDGGGLAIGEGGIITLNNDTVSNNISNGTGAGLYAQSSDTFLVHNTIIVNNKGAAGTVVANCHYLSGDTTPDGIITSTGHNIANDASCNLVAAGDRQGSTFDPNLGVLADNGGPRDGAPTADSATLTRALPTGSIAIDTADNANCPATDERGITRPQQTTCDVGAYEYVLAAAASPPNLPQAGAAGARPASTPWVVVLVAVLVMIALAGLPISLRGRDR